ncbi:MAG: AAA family ATPase, partial [Sandaracinaceae bacterium]
TEDDDVRVAEELGPELGRDFHTEPAEATLRVLGFRARRDRDAGTLRSRAPLVGRRGILRELSSLLIDAAAGRGAIVHLVGEPGVGKSRLLAELRAAAAPRDFVFVHGRADEADAEQAFAAFGDLVMDLCGVEPEDPPELRFEKVERMRDLGLGPRDVRRLGELIGLAYPVRASVRAGRPRGVELALALRKAIRALSRDRVVVLALEDLQWMDDATRQVLPLLVDALVPGRVVVLVTRRPGAAGPVPQGGRTLRVEPLDREAVGRLFAHHLGARAVEPELAEHALALTGGVPAWVELIAEPLRPALIVDDGLARRDGPLPEIDVPTPLLSSVLARLERLRARERSMLRVAAALGGDVDVKLVSSIEGLIGNTERAPLRRLWVRRLVVGVGARVQPPERVGPWGGHREDDGLPTEVRVPGELLRRAILAELDEEELARLHSRVVATLERLGAHESLGGLERLAHHAERSADPRRAPDYHARAAQLALELHDRPRASRHFAEAARLRREQSGDAADAQAFAYGLEAADAALDAGLGELAEQALAGLDGAGERADPDQRVHFAILRARHARQRLDGDVALAALEAAQPLFGEVTPALRDEARTLLARTCVEHGAPTRALEVIDEMVETAEDAALGTALALRATALARLDDLDAAEIAVNEALALAARLGEASLRYASLAALAGLVEARGDVVGAAARYREAAEVAQAVADPDELARLHASAAVCALVIGDLDEATKRTDDAGRWADRTRAESWRLVVAALRGALAILEHPDASYVPGLVRSVERLEELGRSPEAAVAVEMLVHAHLALGDPAAAARTLERAAMHADRAGHRSYARRLHERREALSSEGAAP